MLRLLGLSLLLATAASAQRVPNAPDFADPWTQPETMGWFGTGMGPASVGVGFSVHGTLVRGNHMLTLRGATANRAIFEDICIFYCTYDPDAGTSDVSLLYGRPLVLTQSTLLSLGTGLGIVEDLSDRADARYIVGVPVEMQLGFRTKYVGLSLYGFANLNEARSFAGVGVGATYGLHH